MAKLLRNNAGVLTELSTIATTSGAADADKVPATNGAGVLAPALLNAVASTAGAADAGKIVQLDGAGRIAAGMLPVGVGADTQAVTASEALSAGDLVNIWNNAGAFAARKADASSAGKEAHGFVLAAVAASATATIYLEGTNTAMSGLTPGVRYLSTTPGATQSTAPSGAGQVVQRVGAATSATTLAFEADQPIVLA